MTNQRSARPWMAVTLGVILSAAAACSNSEEARQNSSVTADPAGLTAFTGVSVIPMDEERILADHTVIVSDGVIRDVGPTSSISVPEGATIVDGTGRFLVPGLSEMHAHIPTSDDGAEAVDRTLFLYLAGGVTTIRGMLGHPSHLVLREQSANGEILAPRIFTSGPSFSGQTASTPEAAVARVREQKEAGYDFLKLHPGLSRESFDALAAEADRLDIPFAGHVSADVGVARALESGYASIDHLDGYVEALAGFEDGFAGANAGLFGFNLADRADAGRIAEFAETTRESGVWNVPTQSLLESLAAPITADELAAWPEMRYMPPQTIAQWTQRKRDFVDAATFDPASAARYLELRRDLILALQQAGAGMILGSDAPQWWNVPGFSTRRELEYMVDAGLTPYEALAMGTRNAAVYFSAEAEWGTIAPGLAADMLLLDSNPLEDISNIWNQAGVMVRGEWIPQAEVDRRLEEIATNVAAE